MSKQVLVVIDMQKDVLESDGKLILGKDTSEFKKRVVKKIKEFDGKILATLDTHKENSPEFKQFPPHCIQDTIGWNLSDEIQEVVNNKKGEVISKESFAGGDVTEYLVNEYLSSGYEFEFVGVCTHICIHDSIAAFYHAAKEGTSELPKITVQKDLVDDFDDEMAKAALTRMERLYNVKVV